MSAGTPEGSTQDVDLNLAPIIDCFTVLITYLLVTASFLTLSSVDVGVSAIGPGSPPPDDGTPPPLVMTLEIKTGGAMEILIRGGADSKQVTYSVAGGEIKSNMTALNSKLLEIQSKFPSLNEVSVSADPAIVYKDIVLVLHEIQNVMPKVYISG